MKTKAIPLDAPIKFEIEFESKELYEMYLDENWHKVLIHNLHVLSSQIQFLKNVILEIENNRIKEKYMMGQSAGIIRGQ